MLHSNKSILSNLSLCMLFLPPIAHAESNGQPQATNQLQSQMQQLQTQLKNANGKITALETAMNMANQDNNAFRNCQACKLNAHIQSDTANTVVRRTANGHGR